MEIQDVFRRYEADLSRVEACMEENMHSEVALIPEVVRHLTGSGGKRLRPLLLLACADLCGYTGERRYPLATVIEFLHTASLFHDDVIDEARTRRGRTSANTIWGNEASVLVGDFLYSKAFRLMTADGSLPVMTLLSATTNLMSEGEVFQLVKCGEADLSEADYRTIIERKTAILISAACALGAMLGDAPAERVEALRGFGLRLGAAFQMTDDTLDYVAREAEFGKAVGKDLREGKMTLPLIHALREGSAEETERIRRALRERAPDEETVRYVMEVVRSRGGIDYALGQAETLITAAKEALSPFPAAPPREALFAISDYVLVRNR
jgi:octaprenyl-diphosphate synthase